jgi:hypothetical protein
MGKKDEEKEKFFVLIYFEGQFDQMTQCKHMHDTLQEAIGCAEDKKKPGGVLEWVKGREPQFQAVYDFGKKWGWR